MTTVTCTECGTVKRFVHKPGHMPSVDQPETWTEVVVAGVNVGWKQKKQNQPQKGQRQTNAKAKNGQKTVSNTCTQTDNVQCGNGEMESEMSIKNTTNQVIC